MHFKLHMHVGNFVGILFLVYFTLLVKYHNLLIFKHMNFLFTYKIYNIILSILYIII